MTGTSGCSQAASALSRCAGAALTTTEPKSARQFFSYQLSFPLQLLHTRAIVPLASLVYFVSQTVQSLLILSLRCIIQNASCVSAVWRMTTHAP